MRNAVVVPVVCALLVGAAILPGCSASTAEPPERERAPAGAGDGAETGKQTEMEKIAAPLAAEMLRTTSPTLSALVFLRDEADTRDAELAPSREAKTAVVYDALRKMADRSQSDLVSFLTRSGVKHRAFHIANMIAIYDATPEMLQRIAARDDVKRLSPNRPRALSLPASGSVPVPDTELTAAVAAGPNIAKTGADRVWSELGVTGAGIVVAGQDSGVEWNHPALKAKYRGWNGSAADHRYSWHDAIRTPVKGGSKCGYNVATPCDDHGHGTHTMGTIVGDDGAGNRIGMAPGAKWMACRNMDNGTGTPATYIECFEFFLAPYPQNGNPRTDGNPALAPHVVNNSWGCDASEGCSGGEILPVLRTLERAGIMVVASAGNEGPGCSTIGSQPATHSAATLSVGAHDHRTNVIAGFSSRGPSTFDGAQGPDVSAPGVSIRSSIPGGRFSGSSWSGTSMAGPHVVGEVALLWSADATLKGDIATTVSIIRGTATPKTTSQRGGGVPGSRVPNNTYGYGLIDAYKAVKSRVGPAL